MPADFKLHHYSNLKTALASEGLGVRFHGFVHHSFERDLLFRREAAAVFVFGGVAGDGAVEAGDFYADVAEAGGDGGPFASEDLAGLFAAADA
jgi:hypothetical protein